MPHSTFYPVLVEMAKNSSGTSRVAKISLGIGIPNVHIDRSGFVDRGDGAYTTFSARKLPSMHSSIIPLSVLPY